MILKILLVVSALTLLVSLILLLLNLLEKYLPTSTKKFEGIVRFAIVLFVSNFFWKFSFSGDDNFDGQSIIVTFLGLDLTTIFDAMIYHIADMSYIILHSFGYPVELIKTLLQHENGNGVVVIWGCSGLKQSFIFLCIMLFSRGPLKHKIWYALLGLAVVYVVNIFRIVFLTMLVENYRHLFDLVHDYFFKYLFYFIIFMIWVLWEEVIIGKVSPQLKEQK